MANSNGWGDGAANNSIGWGQGANNNIGWGSSHATSWASATDIVGITTDPAASAYFTATGITGATQQAAIDNLVKGLKADGIWTKMKAVYPFATDNRNLLGYTEDFGNAAWTKTATTVTANTTTAPNGTLTADTLTADGLTNIHEVKQTVSVTSGVTYALSIYAKKNTNNFIQLLGSGAILGSNAWANFDLNLGVVGSVGSAATATIENVGNGWYRCTMTSTAVATSSGSIIAVLVSSATSLRAESNTLATSVFLWGAQLDAAATATTYQPIATTQQAYIASQFKFNLVNPVDSDAAFRLVFNGGWTHSSNGATPNGTNGYADSYVIPSSVLSLNSGHFSYYIRNNYVSNKHQIFSSLSGTSSFGNFNNVNEIYTAINDATIVSANLVPYTRGNFIGTRTNSTDVKLFVNTNSYNKTIPSTSLTTTKIFIGARNNAGSPIQYSSEQLSFSSIGDGLTDTEAANLYTRVQAFQTSLSRQV